MQRINTYGKDGNMNLYERLSTEERGKELLSLKP